MRKAVILLLCLTAFIAFAKLGDQKVPQPVNMPNVTDIIQNAQNMLNNMRNNMTHQNGSSGYSSSPTPPPYTHPTPGKPPSQPGSGSGSGGSGSNPPPYTHPTPGKPPGSGSSQNSTIPVPTCTLPVRNFFEIHVSDEDFQTLIKDNNEFAIDLFKNLNSSSSNVFFSPLSINLAIAMAYAGANGTTASGIAKAMHYDIDQDRINVVFEQFVRRLPTSNEDDNFTLNIVNSIWGEKDHTFLDSFTNILGNNFMTCVREVDFVKQSPAITDMINQWVSNETNAKIQDLIPAGTLNAQTIMVLVNAIYFKGAWDLKFNPDLTKEASFNLLSGVQMQVPMMTRAAAHYDYYQGNHFQAIRLPYSGGSSAMTLILPDSGKFNSVMSALNYDMTQTIFNGFVGNYIKLSLPKFKFSEKFMLSAVLEALGMTDAFSASKADFSGMDGQHDLLLSEVLHAAMINLDESGTEAAAATAVVVTTTAMPIGQPLEVTFDRPFAFYIHDNNNTMLFFGQVVQPIYEP